MSISSLDAVTALAPPRATDPPRAGDGDRAFEPALRQAYNQDRPRESTAARQSEDKPAPPESKPPAAAHDEHQHRSHDAEAPVESAAVHGEEDKAPDDSPLDDTAEISDEAAAAAAVAEAGKPVKDVKAAGEEASKNHATAQAAAVESQGKGATAPTGEPGSDAATQSATTEGEAGEQSADKTAGTSAAARERAEKSQTATDKEKGATPGKAAKASQATDAKLIEGDGKSPDSQGEPQIADNAPAESSAVAPIEGKATKAAAKKSDAGDDIQPPVAQVDNGESVKAPSAQQVAQAAVAVDAVVSQATSSKDGESAKTDASARPGGGVVNSAAGTKSSPTLDRLAARALRSSESESSSSGAAIDRPRFVQRIEGALRAAQQRDGRIQVRLSPPELGNLRIELAVQNGVMTAKLEAETPAARNALLDNLPALRDRLAQQDIRVEKFEVDIRRDTNGNAGGGGAFDKPTGQQDSDRQEGRTRPAPLRMAAASSPRSGGASGAVTDSSLDVRI